LEPEKFVESVSEAVLALRISHRTHCFEKIELPTSMQENVRIKILAPAKECLKVSPRQLRRGWRSD
jgi:hypothetical protein